MLASQDSHYGSAGVEEPAQQCLFGGVARSTCRRVYRVPILGVVLKWYERSALKSVECVAA